MTVSKVLGAQAGIQYSGVSDKSEADPTVQLLNGVIFGRFKRGRFDKPFKVTSESIRAKLGYDPTNKDYVAVEDALANGAPFVWVIRVLNLESTSNPEPVWGLWQLNQEISINSNMARYTASKTNGKQLASSYAEIDLIAALVRSFADIDMQQWQAVKDAANQLTGVNDWVLDPANNRIVYYETNTDSHCSGPFNAAGGFSGGSSAAALCTTIKQRLGYESVSTSFLDGDCRATCTFNNGDTALVYGVVVGEVEKEEKYLPLPTVAQQVISNAESLDQGISLLAETYIKTVAKSIFNSDQSKQFVKQDDLVSQFEENKILN